MYIDQILVAFGCLWLLWSMNLSDCLFLHWTLVGSLVLLVEAVHFSSARKAGGPSQPLLNLGVKFETWCYGAPTRTISSKLGRCLHWVSSACS